MIVPLTAQPKYKYITDTPTWIYHQKAAGGLTGVRVTTPGQGDPDLVQPAYMIAGLVRLTGIVDGGLFHEIAKAGKSVLVRNVDLSGAGTVASIQTVNFNDHAEVIRDILPLVQANPFVPFVLAPNEMIKAVTSLGKIGFFVSLRPNHNDGLV